MITASGLLISCAAAAARLATYRRVSRSRIAASASLWCVMSRAIEDAPTTLPSAFRIGDTVTDMLMRRPFFLTPTVS